VAAMVRPKKQYTPRMADQALGMARYRLYLDLAELLPRHWATYRSGAT
jgi:L-xylulokinase